MLSERLPRCWCLLRSSSNLPSNFFHSVVYDIYMPFCALHKVLCHILSGPHETGFVWIHWLTGWLEAARLEALSWFSRFVLGWQRENCDDTQKEQTINSRSWCNSEQQCKNRTMRRRSCRDEAGEVRGLITVMTIKIKLTAMVLFLFNFKIMVMMIRCAR